MKKLQHIMKGIKWENILVMILFIISIVFLVKYIININTEPQTKTCNWSDTDCKIFEEHKNDMQKYLEK